MIFSYPQKVTRCTNAFGFQRFAHVPGKGTESVTRLPKIMTKGRIAEIEVETAPLSLDLPRFYSFPTEEKYVEGRPKVWFDGC